MRSLSPLTSGRETTPRALTADAWYTLLYVTPPQRERLHARRRRLWTDPLVRAGHSRASAGRLVEQLGDWKDRCESAGRTPRLSEQVAWLERTAAVRLDALEITATLDRALLGTEVRAAPSAAPVLRRLMASGVRLGVVSNVSNESGAAARAVLDRLGLLPLFEVVYLSCEHRWSKPRPEPFRAVGRYLGVDTARTVHVGDLMYDVRGARAAGSLPVLFTGFAPWNAYLAGAPNGQDRHRELAVHSWVALERRWSRLAGALPAGP